MLGVKSTCKDRWRQILTEANRIPLKHLITLEPSISENQTDEMLRENVRLIIPMPLHDTYSQLQRKNIINIREFISYIKSL